MELYNNADTIVFTTPLPELEKRNIDKNATILELGCGYGRIMKHLYECGYHNLTGIDLSEELIQRAQKECPQAQYILGNIADIEITEHFDIVIICGVIEYLLTDEVRNNLLKKIYNILNFGGKVYLETFIRSVYDDFYEMNVKKGLRIGHIRLDNGLELYHATVDEMDYMFSNHKFIKLEGNQEEFVTWSGENVAGYTCVYQKTYGK